MLVYYPALIGCRILQGAIVIRQYENEKTLSPGMIALMVLHGFSLLDFFLFEPTILHAHGMLHSGFGLKRTQRVLLLEPFIRSIGIFFIGFNFKAGFASGKLESYDAPLIGLAAAIYLLGLWIHRCSINQKFLFRCDPHHPSLESKNRC